MQKIVQNTAAHHNIYNIIQFQWYISVKNSEPSRQNTTVIFHDSESSTQKINEYSSICRSLSLIKRFQKSAHRVK